ncbi:MAG: PDZ domain-containing protein [Chitinophagaceae bacterium]|nr:PDZ domain-containing protein [Chitinophagaceae bacterium]
MKRISLYALALVAATQVLTVTASAQDKKVKEKIEKKEQIIIRKKGDRTEKTTIVIEGDKITVNGKPVTKDDKDIIIERFDGDGAFIMRMPKVPGMKSYPKMYRFEGPEWNQEFMKEFKFDMKGGAFLGVITNENDKGAAIDEVQKETAAEKAGLQKGDIITKVGDKKIDGPDDLVEAITAKKPNDEVEITYLRDGKEKKAKVKLGESKFPGEMFQHQMELKNELFKEKQRVFKDRQFEFQYRMPQEFKHFEGDMLLMHNRPQLGATIQDTEEGTGVKVLEVDKDSPADKGGLQKDDVITEINGKKVENVGNAREALREKNEKNIWNLKVTRGGNPVNIEVKIPKKLNKADL